jgi:hypothetical protein
LCDREEADLSFTPTLLELNSSYNYDKFFISRLRLRKFSLKGFGRFFSPFAFVAQGVIQWAFPDFERGKFIPPRRFTGLSLFEISESDEALIIEIIVLIG